MGCSVEPGIKGFVYRPSRLVLWRIVTPTHCPPTTTVSIGANCRVVGTDLEALCPGSSAERRD